MKSEIISEEYLISVKRACVQSFRIDARNYTKDRLIFIIANQCEPVSPVLFNAVQLPDTSILSRAYADFMREKGLGFGVTKELFFLAL